MGRVGLGWFSQLMSWLDRVTQNGSTDNSGLGRSRGQYISLGTRSGEFGVGPVGGGVGDGVGPSARPGTATRLQPTPVGHDADTELDRKKEKPPGP